MKVLIAGFKGKTNSAKLLVDRIEAKCDKLYLTNSFIGCKTEIESIMRNNTYDLVIAFGQKPKVKAIYLEQTATVNGNVLISRYDSKNIKDILIEHGFEAKLSSNAGKYLCNHVYYTGLQYINYKKLRTAMLFIHIPTLKSIANIDLLAKAITSYLDSLNTNNDL